MQRGATGSSLLLSLALGLGACGDSDGAVDVADGSIVEGEDGSDASLDPREDDVDAGEPASGSDELAFELDGELVDFAGANNASYYQEASGSWRFVVVMNDVLADKYILLDISATSGEMIGERSYDCSKAVDEEAMGRAKLTLSLGEAEWKQAEGKPCTITISSIGEVGGRLTGSFSATLAAEDGGADAVIEGGVFDVERNEY